MSKKEVKNAVYEAVSDELQISRRRMVPFQKVLNLINRDRWKEGYSRNDGFMDMGELKLIITLHPKTFSKIDEFVGLRPKSPSFFSKIKATIKG
ncbi:hypothetical protein [Candidatus Lokiarchaeum ossiferum]|uniref:hypothetical protein n=1 Tax=Candidatus Lokiarchaeum ossiferum TaxID=2951803 RepID=UPI00352DA93D